MKDSDLILKGFILWGLETFGSNPWLIGSGDSDECSYFMYDEEGYFNINLEAVEGAIRVKSVNLDFYTREPKNVVYWDITDEPDNPLDLITAIQNSLVRIAEFISQNPVENSPRSARDEFESRFLPVVRAIETQAIFFNLPIWSIRADLLSAQKYKQIGNVRSAFYSALEAERKFAALNIDDFELFELLRSLICEITKLLAEVPQDITLFDGELEEEIEIDKFSWSYSNWIREIALVSFISNGRNLEFNLSGQYRPIIDFRLMDSMQWEVRNHILDSVSFLEIDEEQGPVYGVLAILQETTNQFNNSLRSRPFTSGIHETSWVSDFYQNEYLTFEDMDTEWLSYNYFQGIAELFFLIISQIRIFQFLISEEMDADLTVLRQQLNDFVMNSTASLVNIALLENAKELGISNLVVNELDSQPVIQSENDVTKTITFDILKMHIDFKRYSEKLVLDEELARAKEYIQPLLDIDEVEDDPSLDGDQVDEVEETEDEYSEENPQYIYGKNFEEATDALTRIFDATGIPIIVDCDRYRGLNYDNSAFVDITRLLFKTSHFLVIPIRESMDRYEYVDIGQLLPDVGRDDYLKYFKNVPTCSGNAPVEQLALYIGLLAQRLWANSFSSETLENNLDYLDFRDHFEEFVMRMTQNDDPETRKFASEVFEFIES